MINLVVLLAYFNWAILQKEKILNDGKLLLIELTPFKDKSMMQGDYIQLHYQIQDTLKKALWPFKGNLIVQTDSNAIVQRVRLQDNIIPKSATDFSVEFTRTKFQLSIGSQAFFIQEGDYKKYLNAKYAGLKVDDKGNSLLVGLYNEKLQMIQ